ncbi:MAG TPA: DUF3592 domain-containing protein [Myxococcales bacterium]|nr:DUF3592 domain-containing protein [Myxococcales bacterium]
MARLRAIAPWLVAVGCGLVALVTGLSQAAFVSRAATAHGVVTRLDAGGSHPEIAFEVGGRRFEYPQGGLIFGYRPGDAVAVLYDPANPAHACLESAGALWFVPGLMTAIGLFWATAILSSRAVSRPSAS